ELRAHMAGHGEELAELGVHAAIAEGRPAAVLAWAERHRATWLRARPVRPPGSHRVQTALTSLRATVSEIEEVTLGGGDPRPLMQRQARIERQVTAAMRVARDPLSRPVPAA